MSNSGSAFFTKTVKHADHFTTMRDHYAIFAVNYDLLL